MQGICWNTPAYQNLGRGIPKASQAARVALCRALVMKPRIILADEPTGQLDHYNALNIAKLLKTVSRDFRTGVVMVTHSEEVAALADRQVSLYRLNNKQD